MNGQILEIEGSIIYQNASIDLIGALILWKESIGDMASQLMQMLMLLRSYHVHMSV